MQLAKRVFLFVIVNILVVTTISIVISLISAFTGLNLTGNNLTSLIVLCTVWGMGGSFVSLMISKWLAKSMMGVSVVDPRTAQGESKWLVERVYELSRKAGLKKMPEVGIYDSAEINAFATGPSKNNSLVAVSTGLLSSMSSDEIEGVLAHEVAHVANGDMVTLALIQGIVNAFVMIIARLLANVIMSRDDDDRPSMGYHFLVMGLQFALGALGWLVVAWFSRQREFRADQGGARYSSPEKMANALRRLKSRYEQNIVAHQREGSRGEALASFKISQTSLPKWTSLASTHPPLEERIKRLDAQRIRI